MEMDDYGHVTNMVNQVLIKAKERIDLVINDQLDIGVTQMSKDIAAETGFTFSFTYSIISAYIEKHPKVFVQKGPKGGVKPRNL